jgi:hypothetical protein
LFRFGAGKFLLLLLVFIGFGSLFSDLLVLRRKCTMLVQFFWVFDILFGYFIGIGVGIIGV